MGSRFGSSLLVAATAPEDDPTRNLTASSRSLAESFQAALPRIGVAIVVVAVGYGLARLLRWFLRRAMARRRTPSFAAVMSKLASWGLLSVFVAAAASVVFPSVKPVNLLAGLGFFSVAIGFAFQDILENTLSGVLLLFRQPFASGDQISVQEQSGTVQAITIRETRIKTFDGQLVLIPNRDVYKNVITVQTHFPTRRLAFTVGIAYENDARQACEVIVAALREVEGIEPEPAPEALVSELAASTVDIDVRFWCEPTQHAALLVTSEAIIAVKAALDAAAIEMPADITVLQATPSFRAAVHGGGEVTPGGSYRRSEPSPASDHN